MSRRYAAWFMITSSVVVSLLCFSCFPPTPGGPTAPSELVIDEASQKTIEDSCAEYRALLATKSPEEARAALVESLKGQSDVQGAHLCDDDHTVWVKLANGKAVVIDTGTDFAIEGAYDAETRLAQLQKQMTKSRLCQAGGAKGKATLLAKPPGPGSVIQTTGKRKALFLSAATESLGGAATNVFNWTRNDMVTNYGWSSGDITVKNNAESDGYATLGFSDFYGLKDYGIVCICANAFLRLRALEPGAILRDHVYFQVTAAEAYWNAHPAEVPMIKEEWENERIIILRNESGFHDTPTWYFYIRDDLWDEKLGTLGAQYIYLCTPIGWDVKWIFDTMSAKYLLAWEGYPDPVDALDPMLLYFPTMLGGCKSAEQTYANTAMGKTSGTAALQEKSYTGDYFYLPTWANANASNYGSIPGTNTISVTISYTEKFVPLPDPDTVEDIPHAPKEFKGLIPGYEAVFKAQALDSGGKVLGEGKKTVTLKTGANTVSITLKTYDITLTASPASVRADGAQTSTITATLKRWKDGDVAVPTGDAVADKDVTFSTDLGTLVGGNPVKTNAGGQATIKVKSSNEGTATVKAAVEADSKESTCTVSFSKETMNAYVSGSSFARSDGDPLNLGFAVQDVTVEVLVNGVRRGYQAYDTGGASGYLAWPMELGAVAIGDKVKLVVTPLSGSTSIGSTYLHYGPGINTPYDIADISKIKVKTLPKGAEVTVD
ncbi:MAG: hypothetical protein JXQ73_06250 [Phycisphaerae bacterium]|nr:hypothetical protein [Phycisphaerae bacterium]